MIECPKDVISRFDFFDHGGAVYVAANLPYSASRSAQFFASGEGGDCVHGLFFPDADCLKVHVQESFGAASGGYSLGGNAVSSVISLDSFSVSAAS